MMSTPYPTSLPQLEHRLNDIDSSDIELKISTEMEGVMRRWQERERRCQALVLEWMREGRFSLIIAARELISEPGTGGTISIWTFHCTDSLKWALDRFENCHIPYYILTYHTDWHVFASSRIRRSRDTKVKSGQSEAFLCLHVKLQYCLRLSLVDLVAGVMYMF